MTDANRHARRTAPFDSPVDALRRWSERAGAKEALAFPLSGGRLTYRAWYEKSLALARALLDIGLAPGSHVALLAENRLEWPLVQMGVAAMGGVLVPLNTHYRREDLAYAMTRSRSRAIILSPEFRSNAYLAMLDEMRAQLPDLEHVIALDAVEGREPPLSDLLERGHASRRELPRTDPFAPASLARSSITRACSRMLGRRRRGCTSGTASATPRSFRSSTVQGASWGCRCACRPARPTSASPISTPKPCSA
jgi:fatty-acyl-CoA synthase